MTLKIGVVSDLHLEFGISNPIIHRIQETLAPADLILMPGDICYGETSVLVAQMLFPEKPVFLVAGNHEFYGNDYTATLEAMHRTSQTGNARFLHRECAIWNTNACAVRILGTTLWTDYNLYGNQSLAMVDAREINDFRNITHAGSPLMPFDVLEWHRQERSWLEEQLAAKFDGITVVMTHHAPVAFGSSPRFAGDRLSPCFASRLDEVLLSFRPDLVVWGHTHHCVDRVIDGTRFVSSQTGYPCDTKSESEEYGSVIELAVP